jgi:hypothetical protein
MHLFELPKSKMYFLAAERSPILALILNLLTVPNKAIPVTSCGGNNRNEYQEYSWGAKGGWRVWLRSSTPFFKLLSRKWDIIDV